MSGVGTYTTAAIVRAAATAHGFEDTDATLMTAFDDLLFSFACGTIDAAMLVAHGRKTIHPEDFASLAKLRTMLFRPLTQSSNRGKGLVGGTTHTGSYFSPGEAVDQTAYLYSNDSVAGGHGASTSSDDLARTGLQYHSITGGSAGTSTSKSKSGNNWWTLPIDSVTRILREYRTRFNTDLRVTDAAKLYVRATLQTNMDAVLQEASVRSRSRSRSRSGSKGTSRSRGTGRTRVLSGAALRRAAEGHVLLLVPA